MSEVPLYPQVKEMEWLSGPKEKLVLAHGEFIISEKVPRKGNSNSHGARPVHLIISIIKWIRTSRLSTKNSLSGFVVWSS